MGKFVKVLSAVLVIACVVCGHSGKIENENYLMSEVQCRGSQVLQGVNFQIGSAVLLPESFVVLDAVVDLILKQPNVVFELQGHTSAEGAHTQRRVESNRLLSRNRAVAVMQYLIQKGVLASQIIAVGYGESFPIASNDTEEGRALNDRIVLVGGHNAGAVAICTAPQVCTICGEVLVAALGHAWNWTTIVPTCEIDGEETEFCTRCGEIRTETRPIEKLGHSLSDWIVRIEPTCDTDGDSIIICKRANCNHISETKVGTKLEHIFSNWTETIAPTCTTDGEETEICSLCGIAGIQTQPIEKLGHSLGNWITTLSAMCEREGEQERVCTRPRCDHSEEQKIPALGHLWGTWGAWRDTTATCMEDGDRVRTRTCGRCSGTDRETQAVSALGHVWNGWSIWNTIIAASCTAEGSRERTRTCRACTEIENDTREIPQLTELDGCDPSSIRGRQNTDSRYGIILESAIVSDVAKISVITPELATINLSILDNLGNVVFSATEVGAGLKPAPTNVADNAITWNLTNSSGRFVANGTYLIIVEATGISGRKFTYSARIGVSK